MSQALQALARTWREEAETVRHRYADARLATICETHAQELETALRTSLDQRLTINDAAKVSGYSYSHLRRLLDSGEILNVGEPGAPRVRVGDLPFKCGRMTPGRAIKAKAEPRPGNPRVRRISPK